MALTAAGLSAVQERVYRWLLGHPRSAPAEVTAACDVTPAVAAASIDALVRRGLLSVDDGLVEAVDPTVAVPVLVDRARRRASEQFEELARITTEVAELAETFRHSRDRHLIPIEAVRDVRTMRALVPGISRQTRSTVRNMQRTAAPPESMRSGEDLTAESLRRGVEFRSLYSPELMQVDHHVEAVRHLQALGSRVRTGATPFDRLIIADRRVALLSASDGATTGEILVVRDPLLVSTLADMFDACWGRGHDVTPDGALPSARGLAVLRLLLEGGSDAATAQACGISVRQVGRELARLAELTGVTGRLALGAEAVRRGWV